MNKKMLDIVEEAEIKETIRNINREVIELEKEIRTKEILLLKRKKTLHDLKLQLVDRMLF